jgi:hypothetical protein
MKTSFSVKITGNITVSFEPSNENGTAATDVDGGEEDNVLFEAVLAPYMKSLMNDTVKKNVCDKRITVEEEEEEEEDDLSSPIPKRRIPVDADDSVEDEEAYVEEDDDEEEDEAGDLPNVQVEYQYDNSLSQKMTMMNLRHK